MAPTGAHDLPHHVAIVMDGNGRWATQRYLPRTDGHRQGIRAVRQAASECLNHGIPYLTLFVFSTENQNRPKPEIKALMGLLMDALRDEVENLQKQEIRVRVVGNRALFSPTLQKQIQITEESTRQGQKLQLTLAINYGGRQEILEAINRLTQQHPEKAGEYSELDLRSALAMGDLPEPDLFIRTGGEQRISNFMLWHLAYTELFFTKVLWPDFDESVFNEALASYQRRERRFGCAAPPSRVAAH